MTYKREFIKLNRKARESWYSKLVSNRFVKEISEAEWDDLRAEHGDELEVYLHAERDDLTPADSKILADATRHIVEPGSDQNFEDFEHGYCFFADLWKGEGGKPIVVLHYQH